ncbi:hypothetical protein [Streptomyces sp. NPDC087294]|uniref:hypothetical protein n=1 Tax=Streptomyces sp. NPDC087294 TaxID=3365777 RepID=UPI003816D3F2
MTYITPLDCHADAPGAAGRGTPGRGVGAAFVAALNYSFDHIVGKSVGGAHEGAVPSGGTQSKIVARGAGAMGVIGARLPLSIGRPVQGRQVDDETRVPAAPNGGVRFGVYTGPMTKMASILTGSAAVVTAVGR